jgi:hypothetical protein
LTGDVDPPRFAPSTRVTGSTPREAWIASGVPLQPRPTSDAPSRKGTPLEGPGCFPSRQNPYASGRFLASRAPGPGPPHAASYEGIALGALRLLCLLRAPSSDEESAWGRLDSPAQPDTEALVGATRRSVCHDFYDRFSSRADVRKHHRPCGQPAVEGGIEFFRPLPAQVGHFKRINATPSDLPLMSAGRAIYPVPPQRGQLFGGGVPGVDPLLA